MKTLVLALLLLGSMVAPSQEPEPGVLCTNTQPDDSRCLCDGGCLGKDDPEPTVCKSFCRRNQCACKCLT